MTHVTALLLDLANVIGGLLLSVALLSDLPQVGPWIARAARVAARSTLAVGVLALVMGGYYLLIHLTSGPHVFHFELVGIAVGVAMLRDQLFPRTATSPLSGIAGPGTLLLAVFGLVAVVVGIQGMLTPDS